VGFVSHYYEIPEVCGEEMGIVSFSSGISDDGERTYKVFEHKGTGLAYARDIALKSGMTYEQIAAQLKEITGEKHD
jgi:hypothetical protein